ncbi:MAG TPA: ABC transporter ATP-binding protein [Candidatus Acidoferrum sp.]|nr:ABC transporter ATP-binding protein [Candidatus Acidoferrum sp.]
MTLESPLLSARISVDYPNKPGVLKNLSLDIQRGEIVGLVGESGSGKSTLALALLQLLQLKGAKVRGEVIFQGENLLEKRESQLRDIRGRQISVVLQSPLTSLNPALRIRAQLNEAWRAHAGGTGEKCHAAIRTALRSVSLPDDDEFLKRRPSQLSVGQGQRVIIAMAILHRPALLIADEPTSALDTITQSEILSLFSRLNRELDMAILYISHDLLSVAALCHRVAILRDGEIVECDGPDAIFESPRHPYTQRLIAALPSRYPQRTAHEPSEPFMEELPT